ncbi:hypothetical protein [Halorhabdus rudnickae]|uniref:hypothetical protein n=1 Tax=Halorhabdus rudnickae TaxID=1775544 RepID=UPI001083C2F9|nr:hypothetical protein [Halorhabdus rudnickae]
MAKNRDYGSSIGRRTLLKNMGISGLLGLTGVSISRPAVGSTQSQIGDGVTDRSLLAGINDPKWTENEKVEQNVGNNTSVTVGYMGSELDTVYDDDNNEWVEYWKHRFDLSNIGHSAPLGSDKTYNIGEQWFKCGPAYPDYDPEDPIKFYDVPVAGACAWPNPPGGNWSEVIKEIVEKAATEANQIVNLAHTASTIYNAYQEKSFNSEGPDSIKLKKDYNAVKRNESSHSVHFSIHTVPGGYNTAKIESGISYGGGSDEASVEFKVDITDDTVTPLTKSEGSSTNIQSSLRSRFDQMSQDELDEIGVMRVYKSDLEKLLKKLKKERRRNKQHPSKIQEDAEKIDREIYSVKQAKQRLDFEPDGHTYIKTQSMNVDIKKEKSDSDIARTQSTR